MQFLQWNSGYNYAGQLVRVNILPPQFAIALSVAGAASTVIYDVEHNHYARDRTVELA